jgi:signal transduction histidine kinase
MERWGAGDLALRVPVRGRDEIAAVAQSFNQAAGRVEALLAAHRSLLANASHELRSPLTRLGLAIEMQGEAPERLAEIRRNLAELDQLIEEILLASRLDRPAAPERRESVDLLALAAEEAARTGAAASGQAIEVAGDPRLLRRMIRNLLENAVKHGAPPVEIAVGRSPDGRPKIAVTDRGPGIPAAEQARIFEPFHRPAGRGEAAGSWGLGLALVRQIAERHGGAVRCESRAGGGSAFVVELEGHASTSSA